MNPPEELAQPPSLPESVEETGEGEEVSDESRRLPLWKYYSYDTSEESMVNLPPELATEEPAPTAAVVKVFWAFAFTSITVLQLQYFYSQVKPFFPLPAAFLLAQFFFVSLLYFPLAFVGHWAGFKAAQATVPVFRPSFKILYKVFPASFFFVLALLGTLWLVNAFGPATAEVSKGMAVPIAALLQYALLGRTLPRMSSVGILIIAMALLAISHQMSIVYFVAGAVCSSFSAMRSVTAARQMRHVSGSGGTMTFYNTLNSLVILLPIIILFEKPTFPDVFTIMLDPAYYHHWLISGCIALFNNISSFSLVACVTPTTYIVIGQAKHLVVAVVDILLHPGVYPRAVIVSNVLKFVGGLVYGLGKQRARPKGSTLTPEEAYRRLNLGAKLYDDPAAQEDKETERSFLLLGEV